MTARVYVNLPEGNTLESLQRVEDGTVLWERLGKVDQMDAGPADVEIRPHLVFASRW